MQIRYTKHGKYRVAIIKSTKIFGNRLGYLSMVNESSWALRDFIIGLMLRCGDSPTIKLSHIEAVVEKDYPPPKPDRNVKKKGEWARDLKSRSKGIFGKRYDAHTPPKSRWGPWKPLR